MSKPLVVKEIVSPVVTIHTTDGASQIVLDQGAAQNTISLLTSVNTKGILMQNDPNAAVQLFDDDVFLFCPNGNVSANAGQIIETAFEVRQSLITIDRRVTLSPAAAVYNELNNVLLPLLNVASRVNIAPDVTGTTINSIIINVGNPNIDGRKIWIQNIGLGAGQTLTLANQAGAGTAGGLILGPGVVNYIIPAGGGASIMFDASVSADGLWLISGI